jgi:hypothetical protein
LEASDHFAALQIYLILMDPVSHASCRLLVLALSRQVEA